MKDIELARDLFETTPKPCSLGDCVDCKYLNKDNICRELKQAESLINRGYQKIKWHKVSEVIFHILEHEFLVIILKTDMSFMIFVIMDFLVNQSLQELLFGVIVN